MVVMVLIITVIHDTVYVASTPQGQYKSILTLRSVVSINGSL
jgi:hypothetical protein